MSFPLVILLYLFLAFVLFWLVFSFFNIFHAVEFGFASVANATTLIIYVLVSAAILGASIIFINSIDWSQSIDIFIKIF